MRNYNMFSFTINYNSYLYKSLYLQQQKNNDYVILSLFMKYIQWT